jgi:hypothetical protein
VQDERPFRELEDAELEDEYSWLRSRRTVHRGLRNYALAHYYGRLATDVVIEISLRYAEAREVGDGNTQLTLSDALEAIALEPLIVMRCPNESAAVDKPAEP